MSERPLHLSNKEIITAGDMSSDVESSAQNMNKAVTYSIHAVWTGTPTGDLDVIVSNDGTNFTSLLDSVVATGGAAGQAFFEVTTVSHAEVKLKYTSTSGSGTLTAKLNAKRG